MGDRNHKTKEKLHRKYWRARKKRLWGPNVYYSVAKKLRREGRSSEKFELMLNQLSLEEVISLKLELGIKVAGGKLFGIKLFSSIKDIAQEAVFRFVLSASRTQREAAAMLGWTYWKFQWHEKQYKAREYFGNLRIPTPADKKDYESIDEVTVED